MLDMLLFICTRYFNFLRFEKVPKSKRDVYHVQCKVKVMYWKCTVKVFQKIITRSKSPTSIFVMLALHLHSTKDWYATVFISEQKQCDCTLRIYCLCKNKCENKV